MAAHESSRGLTKLGAHDQANQKYGEGSHFYGFIFIGFGLDLLY